MNDIDSKRPSMKQMMGVETARNLAITGPDSKKLLVIAFLSYTSFGVLLQTFPPILPLIEREFQISHALASLTVTAFLLPIALSALPVGYLVDRYGLRLVGISGLSLMILGDLASLLLPNFALIVGARALSGLGAGLVVLSMLKLLVEIFEERKRGLALGVFVAGLPVGTGIAFDLLTPLSNWMGWRGGGLVGALMAGSVLLALRRTVEVGRQYRNLKMSSVGQVLRNRDMLGLSLTVMLGYTAVIGFTTWAPSTLIGFAHIPLWLAAVISSILLLVDIPLSPFWGMVQDRAGRRKPFLVLAFTIYLVGSIFISPIARIDSSIKLQMLLTTVTVMGTGCAMFFPAALAIPAELIGVENSGAGYGMFFTSQFVGMMIGPLLIGYVLDHASVYVAFLVVSIMTFLGLLTSVAIRSK